jgi:hypothetical protein
VIPACDAPWTASGKSAQTTVTLKNCDPFAPSDISDEQPQAIRQHPHILEFRREKRELKDEMRSLARTMENSREPIPELYWIYDKLIKKFTFLRKIFRGEAKVCWSL